MDIYSHYMHIPGYVNHFAEWFDSYQSSVWSMGICLMLQNYGLSVSFSHRKSISKDDIILYHGERLYVIYNLI